jgi:hypothetical protein
LFGHLLVVLIRLGPVQLFENLGGPDHEAMRIIAGQLFHEFKHFAAKPNQFGQGRKEGYE